MTIRAVAGACAVLLATTAAGSANIGPCAQFAGVMLSSSGAGEHRLARDVHDGDAVDIICKSMSFPDEAGNIRVVFSLAPQEGERDAGYSGVLATEQEINGKFLRVVTPSPPDATNHTFRVRVYVLEADRTAVCDAGHIRVATDRMDAAS